MSNEELETKVADTLAPFFKDPIDIPCPYCEAAKAVIPIIRAEIIKEIEGNNPFVGYIDVVENIRMAKEQGWNRVAEFLKEGT